MEVTSITLAGTEYTLTTFCNYKFQQASRLLAQIIESFGIQAVLDGMAKLPENPSPIQGLYVFSPLIPKLLQALPDAVCEFVALCCVPNATLKEAYRKEGGIVKAMADIKAELLFDATPAELTRAFAAFVPMLDLDDLKNALGEAAEALGGFLRNPPEEEAG